MRRFLLPLSLASVGVLVSGALGYVLFFPSGAGVWMAAGLLFVAFVALSFYILYRLAGSSEGRRPTPGELVAAKRSRIAARLAERSRLAAARMVRDPEPEGTVPVDARPPQIGEEPGKWQQPIQPVPGRFEQPPELIEFQQPPGLGSNEGEGTAP